MWTHPCPGVRTLYLPWNFALQPWVTMIVMEIILSLKAVIMRCILATINISLVMVSCWMLAREIACTPRNSTLVSLLFGMSCYVKEDIESRII
jgi:hypothetical protein